MERESIIRILKSKDEKEILDIFYQAFQIRKKFLGNKIWIRAVIEFSNYCVRDCLYCGLRYSNRNVIRYRMKPEEIYEISKKIIDSGIETIVLQSGDDFYYSDDSICEIIEKIKSYSPKVAITLSVGERKYSSYVKFYKVGAERYLLKHETSNRQLYKQLHPNKDFDTRISILNFLKNIGYQIGAGNIVGLPNQTEEDLADDILLLKELDVDMAGIGPFIPQKHTPLKDYPAGDLNLTLKVLSLTRIFLPFAHLPATTATLSLGKDKIETLKKSFFAGADVVMINFTPALYKNNYKIYDNRAFVKLEDIKIAAKALDLEISFERGDSYKKICDLLLQKA